MNVFENRSCPWCDKTTEQELVEIDKPAYGYQCSNCNNIATFLPEGKLEQTRIDPEVLRKFELPALSTYPIPV